MKKLNNTINNKINQKIGISLITLVITIIVIVILAGAVILTLSQNNPLESANQAVFKSNVDGYKSELQLYVMNQYSKDNGTYDSTKLNVTGAEVGNIIKSMKPTDIGKFEIEKGNLVYSKAEQSDEYNWARQIGILKGGDQSESTSALWTFDSATGKISGYKGDLTGKTTITIPSKIDGMQVTSIVGTYTSSYVSVLGDISTNAILKTIIVSDGITNIGFAAFYNCKNVTNITIPSSVKSMGNGVFSNCTGLSNITLPSSITSIGSDLFNGCTGLTNITIPNGITKIYSQTFMKCSSLSNIILPSGITNIDSNAFKDCTALTNITIPSSVTTISYQAFYNCSSLTSITIPSSVTTISSLAFTSCSSLTSITIPNSVTSIGSYAFGYCNNLASIIIPSSVTSIENDTFSICSKLTSITVNKSQGTISGTPPWGATNATVTWAGV